MRRVAQTADGAVVTCAGGAEARALRVISTLPVNAIAGIEWEPGLPGAWQRANASIEGLVRLPFPGVPPPVERSTAGGHPRLPRKPVCNSVFHKACSGGAAEISQVTGAMTALKKLAGTKAFLLIGDSKLISYDNAEAIIGQRCTFPAPASKLYVTAAELGACEVARATEAGYVAARDAGTRPDQIGRRHVLEDDQPPEIRSSKRKAAPPIRLRRIFVPSTARAQVAATSRANKAARAKGDLDRLARSLGTRFHPRRTGGHQPGEEDRQ